MCKCCFVLLPLSNTLYNLIFYRVKYHWNLGWCISITSQPRCPAYGSGRLFHRDGSTTIVSWTIHKAQHMWDIWRPFHFVTQSHYVYSNTLLLTVICNTFLYGTSMCLDCQYGTPNGLAFWESNCCQLETGSFHHQFFWRLERATWRWRDDFGQIFISYCSFWYNAQCILFLLSLKWLGKSNLTSKWYLMPIPPVMIMKWQVNGRSFSWVVKGFMHSHNTFQRSGVWVTENLITT